MMCEKPRGDGTKEVVQSPCLMVQSQRCDNLMGRKPFGGQFVPVRAVPVRNDTIENLRIGTWSALMSAASADCEGGN